MRTALRRTVCGLAALGVMAPMGAPAQTRPGSPASEWGLSRPGDGEATPAACRALGFEIGPAMAIPVRRTVPPPIGRPTPQTLNETYTGPPVIVPGPPPPAAAAPPPPPPPPAAAAPVITGSRIAGGTPPAFGAPERYPDATANPVRRVADQPVSTFSTDVDTGAYANVRRFIRDGAAPPADAVRVEEMINYFDYGYAAPESAAHPFAITTAVAASPWAPGRQIVHIGLQGYEPPEAERRPLNLTFLVDVSGSMDGADRLELAKRSMNLIIDRLRPQDRVAVTYYASGAGTALAPVPGDHRLTLRCAVAALSSGGGTAGAQGLANAYDQAEVNRAPDRVSRILMFTDGDFNVAQTDDQPLADYVADKRETGVYLSIYGFGRGNYQDARMQAISQAGNGVAAYVDDLDEARRLFGPAFDRGAFPIADDVKVQVEWNPGRVAEWRLIGYETRLLNEADFANDRIDAGEVGSGASVTALYEITPVGGPTQIADRRYEANRSIGVGGGDPDGEVGFVQVRFKPPGGDQSRLIQQVIANRGEPGAVSAQPPEATRWAIAVAAFGQKLRGDSWLASTYGWNDILEQAQGARGEDPYGQRAEFVQLVRAAEQGLDRPRP